jgi:hypothetical protein
MRALSMKNLNRTKVGMVTGAIVTSALFFLFAAAYAPFEFGRMDKQIILFCVVIGL